MCNNCYSTQPRAEDRRRRRSYTLGQIAVAREREKDFVEILLPELMRRSWRFFRGWSRQWRDDMREEIAGYAWAQFLSMLSRGNDPLTCVKAFADLVLKQYRGFRRVTGIESAQDVMSPRAKTLGRVQITQAGEHGGWRFLALSDRVPDTVAARVDFEEYLGWLPDRERSVLEALASGHTQKEAAALCRVPLDEVNLLREEFAEAWTEA
jgi:hypothetical protein